VTSAELNYRPQRDEQDGALSGIRVLESCETIAGSYCGKLAADLGAEVVKIEGAVTGGDSTRAVGPFADDKPSQAGGGLFLYLNTNKLGTTLNLNTATGRDILQQLAKRADVLIQDRAPLVAKPLGLDFETLQMVNSRLVVVSITPFGQTGPYRDYKGYYLNMFHGGGEGFLTPGGIAYSSFPDRQPLMPGGYLAEYDSGLHAAVALLGALFARELSGIGEHVDVSKLECEVSLNRAVLNRYANEGERLNRPKRSYEWGGCVACKDGYAMMRALADHQWKALVEGSGDPAFADPRFQRLEGRRKYASEVNAVVQRWASNHTKEEIYHGLGCRGGTVGYFATAEDVYSSEQLKERGYFVPIHHPQLGTFVYPSASYKFSKTPWKARRAAPLIGEHNSDIYCGWLGYNREELSKLSETGVI